MGFLGGSGISWTIRKQSAPRSRQITTPTPHQSISTGRMLFLVPNQQCQSTEGTYSSQNLNCLFLVPVQRYTLPTTVLTVAQQPPWTANIRYVYKQNRTFSSHDCEAWRHLEPITVKVFKASKYLRQRTFSLKDTVWTQTHHNDNPSWTTKVFWKSITTFQRETLVLTDSSMVYCTLCPLQNARIMEFKKFPSKN